ncbi:hypothetical protein PIB30_026458 [Stylosanthes scabra]|uniref:PB1-like domain-containing protein n=1 Tax=Stylosanthes scabra TaxID=79078 RepID=A0ABU6V8J7_9FABA|nr:hypothetical protein [Stylosanthes scabra]
MVFFNIKVYYRGLIGHVDGIMRYVGGNEVIVEDNDSDFWCVYEAEEQLARFGVDKDDIAAMWYKDPQIAQYEIGLMCFELDRAALDMVRIAQQSGYVELFVVHEGDQEGFPEIGYIDVGGDPLAGSDDDNEEEAAPNVDDATGGENVGPNAEGATATGENLDTNAEGAAAAAENDTNAEGVAASGDNNGPTAEGLHVGVEEEPHDDGEAIVVDEGDAIGGEVDTSIKGVDANDEGVEAAAEGVEVAAPDHDNDMQIEDDNVVGKESEEDNSDDGEYVPSEENSDSADDGDSFFGNDANEGEGDLWDKGKQKVNDDFSGDECEESEDIEEGHAVGGEEDGDFGEEGERVVYPVHKAKANMAEYSCINFKALDVDNFVDDCYKREAYVRCYESKRKRGPTKEEREDKLTYLELGKSKGAPTVELLDIRGGAALGNYQVANHKKKPRQPQTIAKRESLSLNLCHKSPPLKETKLNHHHQPNHCLMLLNRIQGQMLVGLAEEETGQQQRSPKHIAKPNPTKTLTQRPTQDPPQRQHLNPI